MEQTQNKVIEEPNPQYSNASALETRLSPDKTLFRIELYLRGAEEVIKEGELVIDDQGGKYARANAYGVAAIMDFIHSIVNPSTVQGNFTMEGFENYMFETHVNLVRFLLINRPKFDIPVDELSGLISKIILLIKPFVSRTIDNLERESYPGTLMHVERGSQSLTEEKRGFKRFLGG